MYGFEKESVDIGDMKLALYRHANPGKPTLVMLHGYSADKDVWVRFAKHFTDDYQIIIPDLAGHGDSPYQPEWNYGMPAQAARVMALLDQLNVQQAHFIGNSMGGFLTATIAVRHPERTLSAVMVDAAGITSPIPSDLYKMLENGHNPFLITNRKEFDAFFAMTMRKAPFMPDIVLEAVSDNYIQRRESLVKIFDDFALNDQLENQLSDIKAPAMIWWGDGDQLLHVSAVPLWQAGIPQAEVRIFEGIGHMPMMEIPSQSAKVYQAFLAKLK